MTQPTSTAPDRPALSPSSTVTDSSRATSAPQATTEDPDDLATWKMIEALRKGRAERNKQKT